MNREETLISIQEDKALLKGLVGFPLLGNPSEYHFTPSLICLN